MDQAAYQTANPRQVSPRYGAPDVTKLPAAATALAPLGPSTRDSIQTYANNVYNGNIPLAALHAERKGILDYALRAKDANESALMALFTEIGSCPLPKL